MKLAASYLSYLPNLSFFLKWIASDVFIIADDYQYVKHHYINRTKIKTVAGEAWLTVPVLSKGRQGQKMSQVELNHHLKWQSKHRRSLETNYTYAPYFPFLYDDLNEIYAASWKCLPELNKELLFCLASYLRLSKPLFTSDLNLQGNGEGKLFAMLSEMNCDAYLADCSFQGYLSEKSFEESGFSLDFIDFKCKEYHQQFGAFAPNLSIVDLLFNEGPESFSILKNSIAS